MARRENPCTKEEFNNPNLISDDYQHVFIDDVEMTAENIWNYPGDRNDLVEKLVEYFYNEGFKPYIDVDDKYIKKQLKTLKDKDSSEAYDHLSNALKNSSPLCLDICRHFCRNSFYKVSVNGTPSIEDVYKDKDLLRKVLKNRMGWYTSTETIKKRGKNIIGLHPYLFDISHKMIVQGCHSSMTSANVSNFRPLIAKFLYERYCNGKNILDLSAGWGARFLAAWSLDKNYFGIDPMTASEISDIQKFIESDDELKNESSSLSKLICSGSEVLSAYKDIPEVDYVIVCPPYFKLEEYKCNDNSTDLYSEYDAWLEHYWKPTVQNAVNKMRKDAKFSLIMIQKWGKYDLLSDMSKIIEDSGLKFTEEISYKTTRSHLTDKRKSGNTNKNTEKVITFVK